MRNFVQIIIFIFLVLVLSGCASARINFSKNEVLENDYVSFKIPNDEWEGYKKGKKNFDYKHVIYLENYTPKGAQYDITIHTDPEWNPKSNLFKKESDFIEKDKDYYYKGNEKSFKEQGVNYAHQDQQYVKGMKCYNTVRGRGAVVAMDGGVMKDYQVWCGYYDSTEKENDGKRRLVISYWFKYFPNNIRLAKDKGVPSSEIKSRDEYELEMKEQVKTLIDSLEIKNFDVERMKKEGLYHPNEKYEHMKW